MPDQALYEKLTHYCAYQERCVRDVQQKLVRLKADRADTDWYINKLQQENYLREERFVKAFISGHVRKKWGKAKIKNALMHKGIAAALIEQHLNDVEEQLYEEQLLRAATLKLPSVKGKTDFEKKMKLTRFLLSKGYEGPKVKQTVNRLFE